MELSAGTRAHVLPHGRPFEPYSRRRRDLTALARRGDAVRRKAPRASGSDSSHPSCDAFAWQAAVEARLTRAYGAPATPTGPIFMRDAQQRLRVSTTPPLARSSMAPRAGWPGWARRRATLADAADGPDQRGAWCPSATRRRFTLIALIAGQTWVATSFMIQVLPYHGRPPLELAAVLLFAILFAWISAGFWTALAGFATLALRRDRYAITRTIPPDARAQDIPADARTAIVMPVCNEAVARVFAGLRATYESLAATGALDRFDFFILSDTASADTRVEELSAWMDLCRAIDGFGRVFYRWRQHHIKRKSGNIADFCRRWGRKYRYMVILDADSVMTGECLARLVLMAEANPGAGIIQTVPRAAGRETLFARVQQFATGVYGPVYTAGLHYWQLGEAHYWGHNAIIRVAPFIKHCALGRLPGRGALSGEILSHDFVEAALMRRAGWSVWIAYDLPGSYEEMPPNLIDELARDHRWCQGNLMNLRLCLMKGLHPAHRAVFMTGVMAYLSAPLWFMFLVAATALIAVQTLALPQYFVQPFQLFPLWPEWHPMQAVTLFSVTAALLFVPKILASLLIETRGHGGRLRLAVSVLLECAVSALLAPIRMLFHTQFVVASLLGRAVRWRSPARADAQTGWLDALPRHGPHTLLGIGWAALVWWIDPHYLAWLLPVLGAVTLSIPLSVLTSRVGPGRALRRHGLFLIPQETRPTPELDATRRYAHAVGPRRDFAAAIADPSINALVCAYGMPRSLSRSARLQRWRLTRRALHDGFDALTEHERRVLIGDPAALSALHRAVGIARDLHPSWSAPCAAGAPRPRPRRPAPHPRGSAQRLHTSLLRESARLRSPGIGDTIPS